MRLLSIFNNTPMASNPQFPPALIIPPLKPPHKQTIILLHGRGSSAAHFGPELLNMQFPPPPSNHPNPTPDQGATTPTATNLQTTVPHARFIFPTASRRRATIYKRSIINQWFDNWHVEQLVGDIDEDDQDGEAVYARSQDWLMIEGLQQTTEYLHDLLRREIELVPGGARNVVLGGISQGCAASLVAILLWEGEPLGALVGMCGWLPFVHSLQYRDEAAENDGSFDPFERDDAAVREAEARVETDVGAATVKELRERLELDKGGPDAGSRPVTLSTPVYLGHGVEDDRVPLRLGQISAEFLEAVGFNISIHTYPQLGHWYSASMLGDIAGFLKTSIDYDSS